MSGKGHSPRGCWLPALILSLSFLPACDERPPSAPRPLPVATITQAVDRSTRLALKERWRVGHSGDPAQVQLFRVDGAAVSPGGTVYILDRGNARVVKIGGGGALLGEFGGEGDGPGEFRGASHISMRHDTLFVGDRGNRVHLFSSNGSILETRLLRFPDPEVNSLGLTGASDADWVVTGTGYFNESAPGQPPVLRLQFFRLDPASGELHSLGLRWSHESPGQYHGIFWLQPILQHRPSVGLDGRGHLIVADTLTYRLDVLSLEGEHLLRIENQVPLQSIGDELIEYWQASRNCPAGRGIAVECSSEMDRVIMGMERPSHRPVVGRIRAHGSGFFSVLRADLDRNPFDSDTPSEYDHFSPDGTFIGSTSGVVPLALDDAQMIGLERDSLGVESVVKYEVTIPKGSAL